MTTYWFDRSRLQGRLALTDRDRLDLLHRMSTNDLANLKAGEGCSTVLTTALARIIDRLIVYHQADVTLVVSNYPPKVRAWLQKHIFFQDKVKLRDVSLELGQLELHGPRASEIVEAVGPGASNLPLHHFVEHPFDTKNLLIAHTFPIAGKGFMFIAPGAVLDNLKRLFQDQGAVEGSDERYESLRICAGLPGAGHELTEDYNPLEANLWDSVSFSKGCYIGQEIIARMESRNRLAKTLVSCRLKVMTSVPVGAALRDEEGQRGIVTSVAMITEGSTEVVAGIGFLKPELAMPGAHFDVVVDGQRIGNAEIVPIALDTRHEEHPL